MLLIINLIIHLKKFKIMKKFLTISLILISFAAKGANFEAGYIITNTGDTLYGQIDLRSNIFNQKKCVFRKNNKMTVYSPFEIQSYFLTDAANYMTKIQKYRNHF